MHRNAKMAKVLKIAAVGLLLTAAAIWMHELGGIAPANAQDRGCYNQNPQGVYVQKATVLLLDKQCRNYLPCSPAVTCAPIGAQWETRVVYSYGYCEDEPAIGCEQCPASALYVMCYVSLRFSDAACTNPIGTMPEVSANSGKCY